jgi:hypothetical protein
MKKLVEGTEKGRGKDLERGMRGGVGLGKDIREIQGEGQGVGHRREGRKGNIALIV